MAEPDKILSQHEVDALLSAIDVGAGGADSAEEYDFRRPARVAAPQIRFLNILHESFAKSLQTALSGMLTTGVEVRLAGVQQQPIREVLEAFPHPSILYLVSADPLEGRFLLSLNPSIGYPALERLMGAGKVGEAQLDRPLSPLEWNVADMLVGRLLEILGEAWSAVAPLRFKTLRRESDAEGIRFENPDEPSVRVSLELLMGDHRGGLDVAFPSTAIEAVLSKMVATTSFSGKRQGPAAGAEAGLSKRIGSAEVEVEVRLPRERLRFGDLIGLRPGDLLATRHPIGRPLQVMVEGKHKFAGRLGRLKDRKALKVLESVPAEDGALVCGLRDRARVIPAAERGAPTPPTDLKDVSLRAALVLGRTSMKLKEVLSMRPGELISLGKPVSSALELRVENRGIARGVCVKDGERFALRIQELGER